MPAHFVYALVEGEIPRYVGYTAQLGRRRRDHRLSRPDWLLLVLGVYNSSAEALSQEKWWISRLRGKYKSLEIHHFS